MKQITKDLNTLRENDLITIILHCIYKFTEDPSYATLSELAYTLDKDSFYNLCATFGGCTIRIPTLDEYRMMVKVMLVFQYVNSESMDLNEACEKAGVELSDDFIEMYKIMSEVVESYE